MPYEMATLKKLKMSKKNVEFCLKSSSLTLLKWDSIMDIFLGNVPTSFFFWGGGGGGGVCIPLCGNIPLRGNAVYILLISLERIGNF